MSYSYPLSQIRQPRSYIYSSNEDALTLQTTYPETRLTFYTSLSTTTSNGYPSFILQASNQDFNVIKNDQRVATFSSSNGIPRFSVPGGIYGSNVYITSPTPRKALILSDYNPTSQHAYAGVGFDGTAINYQLPTRAAAHSFCAATNPMSSKEWMRIQESTAATAQVGIGTNVFTGTEALRVMGDTVVQGKIIAQNGIAGALDESYLPSNIVRVDLGTSRINSNILPSQLVYLDPSTNLINNSVLPTSYKFQYLNANKNVGIGTRTPVQKFHVEGNIYASSRIGIGNTQPASRLHVKETSGSIPCLRIDNNAGGNLLESYISGQPSVLFGGSRPSIGIGVTTIDIDNSLDVNGNAIIRGTLNATNLSFNGAIGVSNVVTKALDVTDTTPLLRTETLIQDAQLTQTITGKSFVSYAPFVFRSAQGLSTDVLQPSQAAGTIKVLNASLDVDRDVFIRGAAVTASDVRLKKDIRRITNPLQRLDYLHGYTYRRKDLETDEMFAGVLAQEVLDSLPEAVAKLPHDDMIGVRYTSIIPLLIEAMHALKDQNALLTDEIAELKRSVKMQN